MRPAGRASEWSYRGSNAYRLTLSCVVARNPIRGNPPRSNGDGPSLSRIASARSGGAIRGSTSSNSAPTRQNESTISSIGRDVAYAVGITFNEGGK